MRKIKYLVIHCTDSPDDLDVGFKQINEWHAERGWLSSKSKVSCGYHYIVRRNGRVERGRLDEENGAHVRGKNSNSIGIVWVGRKSPSNEQYKTLLTLINGIRKEYNIDIEKVIGHGEIDHLKTCPNVDMVRLRGNLLFHSITSDLVQQEWERVKREARI